MAIAPVNKFLSVMVPVAPGEQKLYEVPTGTSALVLYAQVANVGVGTYPTVTFIQRRESRSTGLTRDIRVIKDVEIPPNDGVILVDGRMVLEKTPLIIDRVFIQGTQSGVSTITDVSYCEPLGLATVTTIDAHGFSAGEQITLGGIAFTCSNNNSGITTTIFPDPQSSYIVETAPTADAFTTRVGSSNGITHFYNAAIHSFVRADNNSILANNTTYKTPTDGSYDPATGTLSLTIADHGILSGATSHTPNGADYNGAVGILTVTTAGAHGFSTGNLIKFNDNALSLTCTMDGNTATKTYPRSTDPASGRWNSITVESATKFNLNVGKSPIVTFTPTAAEYNPTAGILTATIGTHSLLANTSVKLKQESFKFTCALGSGIKSYPRASGCTGPGCVGGADPAYNTSVNITAVTDTTISLDVGASSNTTVHTFSSADAGAIISGNGSDYAHTFVSAVTNGMKRSTSYVGIATESIVFTCSQDGFSTEHGYPRVGDPAYNTNLNIIEADTNTIKVNVGVSTQGGLVAPLQMEFLASILENSNA
jgi:hypothetical protein